MLQGIDKIKHQIWCLRLTLSDHGKITFANTPHLDTPHLWLRLTSAVIKSNVPNDVIQDFLIPGYLCCPDRKLSEESSLRPATLKNPGNHIYFIKCQCVQILSRKFCSPPILKTAAAPLSDAFYFSGEVSLAAWNDYSSRKSQAGTKRKKMPLKRSPLLWLGVKQATAPMPEHTKLCPRTNSGATEMAKRVKCPSVIQAWGPKFGSHIHLDMIARIHNSSSPTVG